MRTMTRSRKLEKVNYEIRGPIMEEAMQLERAGVPVIKLNIGNPAPFGLHAPAALLRDMSDNLHQAQGYSDSKGLFAAREAVAAYCAQKGLPAVSVDDIFLGNGASELIVLAMQALLDDDDEMLVPAPDYPLWTAAVHLSGGRAVHYLCDEEQDWIPDIEDLRRRITPRTRGIVVINPNNPTGALYPPDVLQAIVELAREHRLILFADEIYDRITYDGVCHTSLATLAGDHPCLTINGLSKSHRIAGFRVGWMAITGNQDRLGGYLEGLNVLASMRLCSNVPAQLTLLTALQGPQCINDYTQPGGRLWEQRETACRLLNALPGVSCTRPQGAFYLFPKLDRRFNMRDDQQFALDLLRQQHLLLVQGTGFNWPAPDHFRLVYLPCVEELTEAITRLGRFLDGYTQ